MYFFTFTNGVDDENLPVFCSLVAPFMSNFVESIMLFSKCHSRHMNQSIKGTFTTITSWIIGLSVYQYSPTLLIWLCVAKHLDISLPRNLLYPGCTFVHRHMRWMRMNSNGIWYSNKPLLRMETFYNITVYSNHMLHGLVPILK